MKPIKFPGNPRPVTVRRGGEAAVIIVLPVVRIERFYEATPRRRAVFRKMMKRKAKRGRGGAPKPV